MGNFKTIEWKDSMVTMIDQRKLPNEEIYLECKTYEGVADAIKSMAIRGAPAIGVAAAMGIALGAIRFRGSDKFEFKEHMDEVMNVLSKTRPTAVNLFWSINQMRTLLNINKDKSIDELKEIVVNNAKQIYEDDIKICKMIGENGSELLKDGMTVMTHCNAGALATAGYGTALGVIRSAIEKGKNINVIANETRPFLQGSRLTAWELSKDNIPVTLITDNMAGYVMKNKKVDAVVVGADRVASNGDVANKIGTYSLSILAKDHNIPFYVAAPLSTIDWSCESGEYIPIEERNKEEITHIGDKRIAADINVYNPAFDITPHENIKSIITENGVAFNPLESNLKKINNKE